MPKTFKGRALIPGNLEGEALDRRVARVPVNAVARPGPELRADGIGEEVVDGALGLRVRTEGAAGELELGRSLLELVLKSIDACLLNGCDFSTIRQFCTR